MTIRVNYPTWPEAIRQIATFLNAAFNGNNRMTRGVDTTQDLIVDDDAKGPVSKSPDGHYWRITVDNAGAISTTDLGTTKP